MKQNSTDAVLMGKTGVFTGKFSQSGHREMIEHVKDLGGKSPSQVTKNTDILVCGDSLGSKFQKAQHLNITIMAEENIFSGLKS